MSFNVLSSVRPSSDLSKPFSWTNNFGKQNQHTFDESVEESEKHKRYEDSFMDRKFRGDSIQKGLFFSQERVCRDIHLEGGTSVCSVTRFKFLGWTYATEEAQQITRRGIKEYRSEYNCGTLWHRREYLSIEDSTSGNRLARIVNYAWVDSTSSFKGTQFTSYGPDKNITSIIRNGHNPADNAVKKAFSRFTGRGVLYSTSMFLQILMIVALISALAIGLSRR